MKLKHELVCINYGIYIYAYTWERGASAHPSTRRAMHNKSIGVTQVDYGAGCFCFRPGLGLAISKGSPMNLAGLQLIQFCTSVLACPLAYDLTRILRHELPRRSRILNGPSKFAPNGVTLPRFTYTWVAL